VSTPEPAADSRLQGAGVAVSGPTESPWLGILARCSLASAVVAGALASAAGLLDGPEGALSALFGVALVVLFFGISLGIGHFAGKSNPSGALGLFAVTYAIKVVGFAAVLFFLGTPDWLARTWFFTGAVVTVVVWQIVEVFVFSRLRQQLYEDDAPAAPSRGA
jgi:ATP synthase protein I